MGPQVLGPPLSVQSRGPCRACGFSSQDPSVLPAPPSTCSPRAPAHRPPPVPADADDTPGSVPRMGGIPAVNGRGERLLLHVGIIDILQSYRWVPGPRCARPTSCSPSGGCPAPAVLARPPALPPPEAPCASEGACLAALRVPHPEIPPPGSAVGAQQRRRRGQTGTGRGVPPADHPPSPVCRAPTVCQARGNEQDETPCVCEAAPSEKLLRQEELAPVVWPRMRVRRCLEEPPPSSAG